jgi:hypothetical protein
MMRDLDQRALAAAGVEPVTQLADAHRLGQALRDLHDELRRLTVTWAICTPFARTSSASMTSFGRSTPSRLT